MTMVASGKINFTAMAWEVTAFTAYKYQCLGREVLLEFMARRFQRTRPTVTQATGW